MLAANCSDVKDVPSTWTTMCLGCPQSPHAMRTFLSRDGQCTPESQQMDPEPGQSGTRVSRYGSEIQTSGRAHTPYQFGPGRPNMAAGTQHQSQSQQYLSPFDNRASRLDRPRSADPAYYGPVQRAYSTVTQGSSHQLYDPQLLNPAYRGVSADRSNMSYFGSGPGNRITRSDCGSSQPSAGHLGDPMHWSGGLGFSPGPAYSDSHLSPLAQNISTGQTGICPSDEVLQHVGQFAVPNTGLGPSPTGFMPSLQDYYPQTVEYLPGSALGLSPIPNQSDGDRYSYKEVRPSSKANPFSFDYASVTEKDLELALSAAQGDQL